MRPREILKQSIALHNYYSTHFSFLDSEKPASLKEAKSSQNSSKWEEAMKAEMKVLSDNQT